MASAHLISLELLGAVSAKNVMGLWSVTMATGFPNIQFRYLLRAHIVAYVSFSIVGQDFWVFVNLLLPKATGLSFPSVVVSETTAETAYPLESTWIVKGFEKSAICNDSCVAWHSFDLSDWNASSCVSFHKSLSFAGIFLHVRSVNGLAVSAKFVI